MAFLLDPVPTMHDQRLSKRTAASFLPNIAIDPTCGRYALKALLKWHYFRATGITAEGVTLPSPGNPLKSLIGYDPETDFEHFGRLLKAPDYLPGDAEGYVERMRSNGPIIASGKGVGHAGSFVGHFILLVGGDAQAATPVLSYKDPLRGDALHEEGFATLGPKIGWICYARKTIGQSFALLGQAQGIANMAFT
ncbi:papain-like cysteine protease family protein [Mangrovicoccus algicola]|uniref:Uncharacterized protein n=1 Tax=Mangrovicoccus algicola TaxID=2771008 RepID=A0A8J6YYJ7_9RHOB|nr:papain-like cysteine protease family protein [Mangrovicoccus algicola]MBE3640322.1 hypothetical protein [Mangrovicoccus algicola]